MYHLPQLQLAHTENVTEVKYMPYEHQLKFGGLKLLLNVFNCHNLHAHVNCDTVLYLHSNTYNVTSLLLLLLHDDYKQQYKPCISHLHCIILQ